MHGLLKWNHYPKLKMETYTIYDTPGILFKVGKKFIIAEPKPGSEISKEDAEALSQIVNQHFEGNFGIISNRTDSVSIDPMVYLKAKETMPRFTVLAIVSGSSLIQTCIEYEKPFIDMAGLKVEEFTLLKNAIDWMNHQIL